MPNRVAAVAPTRAPSRLDNSLNFFIILVSLQTIQIFYGKLSEMSTTILCAKLLILQEIPKKMKNRVKSRGYKLLIYNKLLKNLSFSFFFSICSVIST